MAIRYVALGPLLAGEGSRAFLGLRIAEREASPCALIWVPEAVLSEPELVARLRRETAQAASLLHPHILRVYGLFEVDEGLARVVEFAHGESLRRVLEVAGRLPPGLAARMIVDAALGVQYAHLGSSEDGHPLVHGDLRPETLLVSYTGLTKVTGYGALSVAPREVAGRRVIGRRRYCAPEQLLGGRYAVTPGTDVYLLGVVLYEALTGEIPFHAEKDFDHAVLTQQPALLGSGAVPAPLRSVLGKALAKKAGLRFLTVQAFREAVEEAAGPLPERALLAAFLDQAFANDERRGVRQREIESGLQEYALRHELELTGVPAGIDVPAVAEPIPEPFPGPIAAPQAAAGASAPAAAGTATEASPTLAPAAVVNQGPPTGVASSPATAGGSPPRRGLPPWAITLPLAAAAAVVAFCVGRHGASDPERPPAPALAAPAPAVAPEPSAVARSPAIRGAPQSEEPAIPSPVEPFPAPRPAPPPRAARAARADGTVAITAPPGCVVRIDGKVRGTAPLSGPLPVGAGEHRIEVRLGAARWRERFSVDAGEQVTVDVKFETRDGP